MVDKDIEELKQLLREDPTLVEKISPAHRWALQFILDEKRPANTTMADGGLKSATTKCPHCNGTGVIKVE